MRHDTGDTDYISDNGEQQYYHLHCDPLIKSDGNSIRNSGYALNYVFQKNMLDQAVPQDCSKSEIIASCQKYVVHSHDGRLCYM